jgi:hypothetical protein
MRQGAHCAEDIINIETWVDKQRGLDDHTPNITARVIFRGFTRERQETFWWVGDVLCHVICIITRLRDGV